MPFLRSPPSRKRDIARWVWNRELFEENVKHMSLNDQHLTPKFHLQGSAKRWGLACVNSLPGSAWLQLGKQPRLFADLCK